MQSKFQYRRWLASGLFMLCLGILMLGMNPDAAAQAQSGTPLQILQSDSNHVVLELQVSNYNTGEQTVDGTAFSVITVPDFGSMGEPGKPALPIKGAMIGIPAGAQVALKVLDDQSQQTTLARPPLPAQTQRVRFDPNRPESPSTTTSNARDAATYSANRPYPADAALITSTGNWRSQRYAVVEFHPLQYNPVSRQLIFHRRLRVEVTFTYPGGLRAGSLGGPSNEGPFETVLQNSLLNYDTAKSWRTSAPAPRAAQNGAAYTGGTWYRVGVVSDGIYRIMCSQLPGGINPATLRLFKEGAEMAINVAGTWASCNPANDYLEFFGQSPDSFYSQPPYNQPVRAKYAPENIYWLNFGVANGKRMATRDGSVSGTVQTSFTDTIHLEQNQRYLTESPRVEDRDHWVWDYASQWYGFPFRNYNFSLSRLAGGASFATLQIDLFGASAGFHRTVTSVNGNQVNDTTWGPGMVERQATLTFDKSWLINGTNTITVNEPDVIDPNNPDVIYTNSFNVSYQATFTADSDMLRFRQTASGAARYSISNFGSPQVNVFNITDRFNIAQFNNTTVTGSAPGPYTLAFGDNPGAPAEYIALTPSQDKSPNSITLDTASNLASPSNTADYILITYGGFKANVQPLANFRSGQGLSVKVVDIQDVYDEFSDGLVDAHAIRAFLEYAYANWNQPRPTKPPPSFVLLVGDGTFDPRGYCNSGTCPNLSTPLNATYIPPYLRMIDPWMGEAPSDNRFVSFNDGANNTLPNMMIGRLPANNATEVDTMVNRTIAYEQNPPTVDWRNKMTFVADTAYDSSGIPDPAGNFWTSSDAIASNPAYVPSVFAVNRAYYNVCLSCTYTPYTTLATENSHIVSAINGGSLFLSYIGHGSNEVWSNGNGIFTTGDVSSLSNAGKLTIPLEMTCLTGNFADLRPALNSLAETMLRAKSGSQAIGAVADWAATGLGVQEGHDFLEKGFLSGVMYQGARQIGAATVVGKTYLWTNGMSSHRDLIDTYILFGDPALHLTLPNWSNLYLPLITK